MKLFFIFLNLFFWGYFNLFAQTVVLGEKEYETNFIFSNTVELGSDTTIFISSELIGLDFWATWCGPCIASFPHTFELLDSINSSRYDVIFITDEPLKKIQKFVQFSKFPKIIVGVDPAFFKEFQINKRPEVVILKENIEMLRSHPEELNFAKLKELLKQDISLTENQLAHEGSIINVEDEILEKFDMLYEGDALIDAYYKSINSGKRSLKSYYTFFLRESVFPFGVPLGQYLLDEGIIRLYNFNILDFYSTFFHLSSARIEIKFPDTIRYDLVIQQDNPLCVDSVANFFQHQIGYSKSKQMKEVEQLKISDCKNDLLLSLDRFNALDEEKQEDYILIEEYLELLEDDYKIVIKFEKYTHIYDSFFNQMRTYKSIENLCNFMKKQKIMFKKEKANIDFLIIDIEK